MEGSPGFLFTKYFSAIPGVANAAISYIKIVALQIDRHVELIMDGPDFLGIGSLLLDGDVVRCDGQPSQYESLERGQAGGKPGKFGQRVPGVYLYGAIPAIEQDDRIPVGLQAGDFKSEVSDSHPYQRILFHPQVVLTITREKRRFHTQMAIGAKPGPGIRALSECGVEAQVCPGGGFGELFATAAGGKQQQGYDQKEAGTKGDFRGKLHGMYWPVEIFWEREADPAPCRAAFSQSSRARPLCPIRAYRSPSRSVHRG